MSPYFQIRHVFILRRIVIAQEGLLLRNTHAELRWLACLLRAWMVFVLRIQSAVLSNLRNLCSFFLCLILCQRSKGEFIVTLGQKRGSN